MFEFDRAQKTVPQFLYEMNDLLNQTYGLIQSLARIREIINCQFSYRINRFKDNSGFNLTEASLNRAILCHKYILSIIQYHSDVANGNSAKLMNHFQ